MLPMRCENRTRPPMEITMQNNVSLEKVLVTTLCPYELHGTKKIGNHKSIRRKRHHNNVSWKYMICKVVMDPKGYNQYLLGKNID